MKRKHFTLYESAKKQIVDKDIVVNTYISNMLNRTICMFKYENLPETIPYEELENILQCEGFGFVTKANDDIYIFSGGLGGQTDVYGNPTEITISNPALNINENYIIGKDGVLIKNDFHCMGLLPTLMKYAVLLCDSEISLHTVSILSRISMLISACDDRTKASAEIFIKKILDGEISVIGESAFFEGVKLQTANGINSNNITQLIELIQYYRATAFNEIGLQSNFNMKRETLNVDEIALAVDGMIPLIEEMLQERKKAIKKINEMFNLNISVRLNGVWEKTQEERLNNEPDGKMEPVENIVDGGINNGDESN